MNDCQTSLGPDEETPLRLGKNVLSLDDLHNEPTISLEKIEFYEIVDLDPGNLLEHYVLRLSFKTFDPVKAQKNRRSALVRIGVAAEKFRFTNLDGQFFLQFAAQGVRLAFAIFNFSTRKFPFQPRCRIFTALANQDSFISKDQTSDNTDRWAQRRLHVYITFLVHNSLRQTTCPRATSKLPSQRNGLRIADVALVISRKA